MNDSMVSAISFNPFLELKIEQERIDNMNFWSILVWVFSAVYELNYCL